MAAFSVSASAQIVQFGTFGGGGAATSNGTVISGCTAYSLVYIDSLGALRCAQAAQNSNVSTAGNAITQINATISGSSATSNFLNITGTFPATLSAETSAALVSITGDNDNQLQSGLKATFSGSNTSLTNLGTAVRGHFSGAGNGTGGWFTSAVANGSTNYALIGQIQGSGAMSSAGVVGWSENTSSNFSNHGGVFSGGGGGANPTRAYGVIGMADSDAASGAMGGYFYLATSSLGPSSSIPTPSGTAGLVADNGSVAANIFEARDNGTAVFTVQDGGSVLTGNGLNIINGNGGGWYGGANRFSADAGNALNLGNSTTVVATLPSSTLRLTASTMTASNQGEIRSVTHSYSWTNAMVTALGASLTGDINVATLPAKTRVDSALVVIDTAAGGVTTLTVSCGDAIGGTPFTNYIVASDAKAAANTVYGDLISGAETGASLFDATTKWRNNYVPSYTSTTLVTCHFISTGTNLNTVTTSTGHVILTTTLLP